jgi:phage terminase small subunit
VTDLTDKQARFIEEYLVDLNATQAYLRAYPDSSPDAARASASALLTNPNIQDAMAEAMRERSERTKVTQDMVVRELALIGFADLTDFVEWDSGSVKLKPSTDLDETKRRAIIEVSQTQHGIKIKLADKKGSLDSLGRHLGIFEADNKQAGQRTLTLKKAEDMSDDELAAIASLAQESGD